MTFRTAYELLLIGLCAIVAWTLIVKPAYALITGRSLKVGKSTVAGDTLQRSREELEDEYVLNEADKFYKRAESLRAKRTKSTQE